MKRCALPPCAWRIAGGAFGIGGVVAISGSLPRTFEAKGDCGNSMALHFSPDEFQRRQTKAVQAIRNRGLDGLLMFRQESMYYLTGYDTMGYITFQCMVIDADGRITLLTRAPDKRQARLTSTVEDIRIWIDGPSASPGRELRNIVAERHGAGGRFGIEYDAFGLNASRAQMVQEAFAGFATLADASEIVSGLRMIKSEAELAYVRKAGELADAALRVAIENARQGVSEGEILAEMLASVFRSGGDFAASRWILGSGEHAMMVRHFTGHHNRLGKPDHLQLEFGAAYLHYHACLFRTLFVGDPSPAQVEMHRVAIAALQAARAACRPGRAVGEMFEAYAAVVDEAGLKSHRLNACGYSLGATYPPTWMDGCMIQKGNAQVLQPNMVFFPHMVLLDSERGITACAGETLIVTETSNESLTQIPHDIIVN